MAEKLEFQLEVTGTPKAQAELGKFKSSLGSIDEVARNANSRLSGTLGAVSSLGTIMARVNPELALFAGSIGTAGSAMGGMTTALGGVAGLAVGGLLAALGVFVTRSQLAAQATDKLAQATSKAAADMQKLERQARLAFGALTGLEGGVTVADARQNLAAKQAELKLLAERLDELERPGALQQLREVLSPSQIQARLQERDRLRAQFAAKQREVTGAQDLLEQAGRAAIAEPVAGTERDPANLKGRPGELQTVAQQRRRQAAEEARRRKQAGRAGRAKRPEDPFAIGQRAGRFRGLIGELTTLGVEAAPEETFATVASTATIAEFQATQDAEDRKREAIQQTNEARRQANSLALQGAEQALTAILLGSEQGAKAQLAAIGDALVGQGVSHGLQAAAMAFIPGAQGNAAGLAGVAAIEITTGKAMGALFSPPGNAGGAAAGPVGPRAIGQQQPQTQTIINFNGIADQRIGEQVIESLKVVKRRRGPAALDV